MEQQLAIPETLDLSFSPAIGQLAAALAKARKKFKAVKKTSNNPFFKSKYADLAEVLDATTDFLSENELAVIQSPGEFSENRITLTTLLVHSSGEWVRAALRMPVGKPDAQGVGSAITYARRYAYSAIVNVASEADDDGNAATEGSPNPKAKTKAEQDEFDQRVEKQQSIAGFQLIGFQNSCKETDKTEEQIAEYLKSIGVTKAEDIMRSQFNDAIKWANRPLDLTKKLNESVDQIKQKRMAALFAVAKKKNVPEADFRQYAKETFGKEHLSDLDANQVAAVSKWIEETA